jgi:methionine aminopeptidase
MEDKLKYYNEAARICGRIMKELKLKVQSLEFPIDILELENYGNNRILEETQSI